MLTEKPAGSSLFPPPLGAGALLREAIGAGRAHDEGETQVDGRTLRRIRVEPLVRLSASRAVRTSPATWYVDPETFYPVQAEGPN